MKKKMKAVAKKPARHQYVKRNAATGVFVTKTLDPFPAPVMPKKNTRPRKA